MSNPHHLDKRARERGFRNGLALIEAESPGKTVDELAMRLDVSPKTLMRYLSRHGLRPQVAPVIRDLVPLAPAAEGNHSAGHAAR